MGSSVKAVQPVNMLAYLTERIVYIAVDRLSHKEISLLRAMERDAVLRQRVVMRCSKRKNIFL